MRLRVEQTTENRYVRPCLPAMGRYLISKLALYLGFIWIAFDRRKQGWHDKIAGTVVVRGEKMP